MTDAAISDLTVRAHRAPLRRPWGQNVPTMSVLEVTVSTSDGATGVGFSWTPTIGAHAVAALLNHDIREAALGQPADPVALWPRLWAHLHEAGSGGITTIALAGLDLALWDRLARARDLSLTELLGAKRDHVVVYGSGVNLHYSLVELREQAERWVDAGYAAVKMKVGLPDPHDDVERVAAVRAIVGDKIALMIDANQRWSLEQAERALGMLRAYEPAWIEEPLRADDIAGHAELRSRIDIPVALGENLHTVYRFREAIDAGACDVVQPNVIRVGGITPFLDIARLADERGVALRPHLLPELSGQLALALDTETEVEDVEDATFAALGLLNDDGPVRIADGRLESRGSVGLGFDFSSRHLVER